MTDANKRAELIALAERILRAEHSAVFDVADQWQGGGSEVGFSWQPGDIGYGL